MFAAHSLAGHSTPAAQARTGSHALPCLPDPHPTSRGRSHGRLQVRVEAPTGSGKQPRSLGCTRAPHLNAQHHGSNMCVCRLLCANSGWITCKLALMPHCPHTAGCRTPPPHKQLQARSHTNNPSYAQTLTLSAILPCLQSCIACLVSNHCAQTAAGSHGRCAVPHMQNLEMPHINSCRCPATLTRPAPNPTLDLDTHTPSLYEHAVYTSVRCLHTVTRLSVITDI